MQLVERFHWVLYVFGGFLLLTGIKMLFGGKEKSDLLQLADYFCRSSRFRIDEKFRESRRNADRLGYRLAQQVLGGKHSHLESGIVNAGTPSLKPRISQ